MSKYHKVYMDIAEKMSELSYANRKKVGCIIVRDNRILSSGYNRTPPGSDINCEDENGITKPNVVHAEINAIQKAYNKGESILGATMYVTLSCCLICAQKIVYSGISRVIYKEEYRDTSGIKYLNENEVEVFKWE